MLQTIRTIIKPENHERIEIALGHARDAVAAFQAGLEAAARALASLQPLLADLNRKERHGRRAEETG